MKTADPRIIDDVWRIARQRPLNMRRGNAENEIAVNMIALIVERFLESLEGGPVAAPHSGRRALLEDAKQAAMQLGMRLGRLRSSYATKYVQDLVAAIERDLEFTPSDAPIRTGPKPDQRVLRTVEGICVTLGEARVMARGAMSRVRELINVMHPDTEKSLDVPESTFRQLYWRAGHKVAKDAPLLNRIMDRAPKATEEERDFRGTRDRESRALDAVEGKTGVFEYEGLTVIGGTFMESLPAEYRAAIRFVRTDLEELKRHVSEGKRDDARELLDELSASLHASRILTAVSESVVEQLADLGASKADLDGVELVRKLRNRQQEAADALAEAVRVLDFDLHLLGDFIVTGDLDSALAIIEKMLDQPNRAGNADPQN